MKTSGLLLKILFLSSLLYMINSNAKYAIMGILIIIPIVFIYKRLYKLKLNYTVLLSFLFYFFAGLLSSLLNQDIELLSGMIMMFIVYSSLVIFIPSRINSKDYNQLIGRSIIWTHVLIIFCSLIIRDISIPYKGIFNNSNSFGIVVVMLNSVFVAKLCMYIENFVFTKYKKIKKSSLAFTLLIIPILFVLGIYSGSRTTTITNIIIIFGSFTLIFIRRNRKLKKIELKRIFKVFIYLLLILMVLILYTPLKDIFLNVFINKFLLKINQGDVLSERNIIWRQTVNDASLFGNGRGYFSSYLNIGAHNTFMSLLGQYGWISLVAFIIILIIALRYALKYSIYAKNDDYRFLPITVWMSFFLLSMGEGMMLKINMIAMFSGLGVTSIFIKTKTKSEFFK